MSLTFPAAMGGWEINGVSMIWSGAKPINLEVLWSSAELEIDNLPQPGVDGLLPRDPVLSEARHEVLYQLSGLVLPNGSPAASLAAGFQANHAQLISRVGNPSTWGSVAVPSEVFLPDATSKIAPIQAWVSPIGRESGPIARCSVTVVIPGGRFV